MNDERERFYIITIISVILIGFSFGDVYHIRCYLLNYKISKIIYTDGYRDKR